MIPRLQTLSTSSFSEIACTSDIQTRVEAGRRGRGGKKGKRSREEGEGGGGAGAGEKEGLFISDECGGRWAQPGEDCSLFRALDLAIESRVCSNTRKHGLV
jgi:hypothetical protein